jgi:membrane protein DedA with SNARE-associated domain
MACGLAAGIGYRGGVDEEAAAGGQAAPQKKTGWDDPRTPWHGRPRRVDILCWAGITLSGVFYWATLPFRAPLLASHPVLLELLNGSTEAIVTAAAFARVGHGSLAVALLAAIPGLIKFDPLFWWAGRLWGERVIALLSGRRNRGARYMARVHRWGRKFTWPAVIVVNFVPIPSAIIYVIAGWAGMRLVTFIILDLIGSLLWAGMLVGLGYKLGHHAVVVAQTISHYGLWISLALVALIVVAQVRSQRHMARTAQARADKAGTAQASPAQAGTAQASPAQAGTAQAGTAQAGTAQAGTAQASPARAGTPQAKSGEAVG